MTDYHNGCGVASSICNAVDCKKGGLITERHNKLRDGVADLASKAFTATHVRDDPNMFTGCAVRGGKAKSKVRGAPPKDEWELKGGLLIRDLWMQKANSINDMRVVNANAVSHQS